MDIGQRIKFRREQLDMSQEELAKRLGYKGRSSINKIEIAGYRIPSDKIEECARALMTTPAYLMGWEDERGNALPNTLDGVVLELFHQLDTDDQMEIIGFMRLKLNNKKDAGMKATASA